MHISGRLTSPGVLTNYCVSATIDIMEMQMWTVKEAAKQLGISEQRVRKLLTEGRIKGRKLGDRWVILEPSYTRKRGKKQ